MELVEITKDKDGVINGTIIGVTNNEIIGDEKEVSSSRKEVEANFSHIRSYLKKLQELILSSGSNSAYYKEKKKLIDEVVESIYNIESIIEKVNELRDEDDKNSLISISNSFVKKSENFIEVIKGDKDEHLAINAMINEFEKLYSNVDEILAFEEECVKALKGDSEHALSTHLEVGDGYEFSVDVHAVPSLQGLIPGLAYNRFKKNSSKYIYQKTEKDFHAVMEQRGTFFSLGRKLFEGIEDDVTLKRLKEVALVGNFLSYSAELKKLWFSVFEDNSTLYYHILRSRSDFYEFMTSGFVPAILEVERDIIKKMSDIGANNIDDGIFDITVDAFLNMAYDDDTVGSGSLSSDLKKKYSEVINKSNGDTYKDIVLEVKKRILNEVKHKGIKDGYIMAENGDLIYISSPGGREAERDVAASIMGHNNLYHNIRLKEYYLEKYDHVEPIILHTFSVRKSKDL